MADDDGQRKSRQGGGDLRKQRLAEQLRANLQRRKAQSRSRRTGAEDGRPEGISAAKTPETDAER